MLDDLEFTGADSKKLKLTRFTNIKFNCCLVWFHRNKLHFLAVKEIFASNNSFAHPKHNIYSSFLCWGILLSCDILCAATNIWRRKIANFAFRRFFPRLWYSARSRALLKRNPQTLSVVTWAMWNWWLCCRIFSDFKFNNNQVFSWENNNNGK